MDTKLDQLVMLVASLRAGFSVTSSQIKSVLGPSESRRFQLHIHGPSDPVGPTEIRSFLAEYLLRLAKADNMERTATRGFRRRTWIGPDLFRQAEAAYDHALEALEEALGDHPYLGLHLKPFTNLSTVALCRCGMPRVTLVASPPPDPEAIYSLEKWRTEVESVIEFLDEVARRRLRRTHKQSNPLSLRAHAAGNR